MLTKVKDVVRDYSKKYREMENEFAHRFDNIKKNYVLNSERYNEFYGQADAEKNARENELREKGFDAAIVPIQNAKDILNKIVCRGVDAGFSDLLPYLANMTETEKKIILEKYSDNYIVSKIISGKLNQEFESVDYVYGLVENLETEITDYFKRLKMDSYTAYALETGEQIDAVNKELNKFTSVYKTV